MEIIFCILKRNKEKIIVFSKDQDLFQVIEIKNYEDRLENNLDMDKCGTMVIPKIKIILRIICHNLELKNNILIIK